VLGHNGHYQGPIGSMGRSCLQTCAMFFVEFSTDQIVVENIDQGYVTFVQKFTHLESVITNDLDDSVEFNMRIGKANGVLYSLINLWRIKGLTIKMKNVIYIASTIKNILM
jgi:hypothetical protein